MNPHFPDDAMSSTVLAPISDIGSKTLYHRIGGDHGAPNG
jgi:hypothetical protein